MKAIKCGKVEHYTVKDFISCTLYYDHAWKKCRTIHVQTLCQMEIHGLKAAPAAAAMPKEGVLFVPQRGGAGSA